MNSFLLDHVIHIWLGVPENSEKNSFSRPGKKVLMAPRCPLSLFFSARFYSIADENDDCLTDRLRRFAEHHPGKVLTLSPSRDYQAYVNRHKDELSPYYILPKGGSENDTWAVD